MSADPAKVTFQVGDTVRNLQTNEQRYVIDVVGDALFVLADESKGKHSNRRQWLASNCTLVTPCPFHIHDKIVLGNKTDVVGEIVEIKPHYNGKWLMFCIQRPNPNGGTMTHWANEGALRPVETPASVGDILKETESAALFTSDEMPTVKAALSALEADDAGAQHADPRDADTLLRAAQALADEQEKVIAAEERAKVAELRIKKLEQIIHEHEVYAKQPQPVPAAQMTCVEYKTLSQRILGYPEDLRIADADLARYENEGWSIFNMSYLGNEGEGPDTRYVVFKRTINTPPTPTRGSAEHHIDLTSDFVRQSVETRRVTPQPVTPDAILEPISQLDDDARYLGSYRALFRAGASLDDVIEMSNRTAIDGALERSRARIDATPAFNRPLHHLKASN